MTYHLDWLKNLYDIGESIKYVFFWGHQNSRQEPVGPFVFSQWYECPFTVEGITYPTAEHWMMAHKALLFKDELHYQKIIAAKKPGEVKELGRQITGFDAETWDHHKYNIVLQGSLHKFSQHSALRDYLLSTGNRVLVEASPLDPIWGIGLSKDAPHINNPHTWRGTNLLGFALMEARDALKKV